MSGIIAESQRRVGPAGQKTPFERTLLPSFAAWVIEQIESFKPDYLIPVETKGVHVLDAALAYARETSAVIVTTPVLYTSGLAYLSAETLSGSRVMVVDDAVDSGANLRRFLSEIRKHNVAETKAIVYMGCGDAGPKHVDVDVYLRVEPERYTQYLWQLTDLVVARGLPPEVDHSVYELRVPRRLTAAWQQLQAVLGAYGALAVDGPASKAEEIQPITLHFPRLPGMPRGRGPSDGPDKVRFFPDPDGKRIFVVPISFPALIIKSDVAHRRTLSRAEAKRSLRRVLGASSIVGDLLIDHARELDPVTVFRAISTAREVEMVAGVARLLGATMSGARLLTHRDVFDRLFGTEVGAEVGRTVAAYVESALAYPGKKAARAYARQSYWPEPSYVDLGVSRATRDLARHLKKLSDQAGSEHRPNERVGMSLPEFAGELPNGDRLLASRCVTLGLAMTTLVPYIGESQHEDGSVSVERRYRVSEPIRGDEHPYRDRDLVRCEKSEQTLAVICRGLQQCSKRFQGKPIPTDLLARIVAVLGPLILQKQSLRLTACPGPDDLRLVLLDTVEPITVENLDESRYYAFAGGGIVPTAGFDEQYGDKALDLDVDGCTEDIENHVEQLAGLIDALDEDEGETVLKGWAMSTDRRLGLKHVRRSLEDALADIRRPLKSILTGDQHERTRGVAVAALGAVEKAASKLELLSKDWSQPSKTQWAAAWRRNQRMIASLAAPKDAAEMYELARALSVLAGGLGGLVERLDRASFENWANPEGDGREDASMVLMWSTRLRRALTSLTADEISSPPVPTEARAAITLAAKDLLDLVEQLSALIAAFAGVFRGAKDGRPVKHPVRSGRHLSVLSLDIAGSTAHGEACDERSHNSWVREGLDLAAQWTRAFGGWERPERKGDEITIEYADDGDATVLAAAAILCHTRALRSTGIDNLSWRFHAGVDCGQVEEDHGDMIGRCLNHAAKIAKLGDGSSELRQ